MIILPATVSLFRMGMSRPGQACFVKAIISRVAAWGAGGKLPAEVKGNALAGRDEPISATGSGEYGKGTLSEYTNPVFNE